MTLFFLMSNDTPPQPLEGHVPYVTPEEAVRHAQKEANDRGSPIQIFRVINDEPDSQPWKVVQPSRS